MQLSSTQRPEQNHELSDVAANYISVCEGY